MTAPEDGGREAGSACSVYDLAQAIAVAGRDEGAWSAWQGLFAGDPGARIDQHPEIVREDVARSLATFQQGGYLVQCGDRTGLVTMAALLPKTFDSRRLGGFLLFRRPRGFRLAGDRLLGADEPLGMSEALRAVMRHMAAVGAAFLLLEDVELGSALWDGVTVISGADVRRFLPEPAQPHHRIRLPATFEDYFSQLSGPTRKRLRRAERDIGSVRLVRVTSADQVPWFLKSAREVSSRSWQHSRFGERVRGDDLERRRLECLAQHGALRSYVLLRDDVPIAFEYATQHRGVVSGEEAGYDLRFREYSPGKVLQTMQIRDLYAWNRPTEYDFGKGDAEYKRLFANHTTSSTSVWLVPPGVRGLVMVSWLRFSTATTRGVRRLLGGAGMWSRIRKRHRTPRVGGDALP